MVTVSATNSMSTDAPVNPRSVRGNQGCWACRFRKKRCQRTNESDPICDDCQRFHIVCNGAGEERPRRQQLSQDVREVIKKWIRDRQRDEGGVYEGEPLSLDYLWTQPLQTRPMSSGGGSSSETRGVSPYSVPTHQRRRSGSNIPTSSSTIETYSQPVQSHYGSSPSEGSSYQNRMTGSNYHQTLPVPSHTSRGPGAPGHVRRATTDAIPMISVSTPNYLHSPSFNPYGSSSLSSSPSSMEFLHPHYQPETRTTTVGISQPSGYTTSLSIPAGDYGAPSSHLSVPGVYPSSSSLYQAGSGSTPSINIVVAEPQNPSHSPQTALGASWDNQNFTGAFDLTSLTTNLLAAPGSPLTPNSPHSSFTSFASDEGWDNGIPSPSAYPELYPPEDSQESMRMSMTSSWPGLPAPSASQTGSHLHSQNPHHQTQTQAQLFQQQYEQQFQQAMHQPSFLQPQHPPSR